MSKAEDLKMGLASEKTVIPAIESITNTNLIHLGGYNTMDYTNEAKTVYVELKTRRINRKAYATTIVGLNKVAFCNDPTKSYYFCFAFSDGLFYIKYDHKLFSTFKRNMNYFRHSRNDCINPQQQVIEIPVDLLSPYMVNGSYSSTSTSG